MACSVQNKNFLSLLHKLDIDLNQFPDKTFDGLFENVDDNMGYFFNWFIDNIGSNNVLTKLEEAMYFELESSESLPSDEEVEYFLSDANPCFEEMRNLDLSYGKTFLMEELNDLKKSQNRLFEISQNLEINHEEVKKKINTTIEQITFWKKQENSAKEQCRMANIMFNSKVGDIKIFLLQDQIKNTLIELDCYAKLLEREEEKECYFEDCKWIESEDLFHGNHFSFLEKNFVNAETMLILSRSILKGKKAKVEILTEEIVKALANKNVINFKEVDLSFLQNDSKIANWKAVEVKVHHKVRELSFIQFKKLIDWYYLEKTDLNKLYLSKIGECKKFIKSNGAENACIEYILLSCIHFLEKIQEFRKFFIRELNQYEMNFSHNACRFSLRKQKCEQILSDVGETQFPLYLMKFINGNEDTKNNEITLKNMFQLLVQANDDFNFAMQKFRLDMQSSIKRLLNDVLCGPTSQILHAPVDLVLNFQKCEKRDKELSQKIKRLVNKYLETKETVARSDRKLLLLWTDFLTNSNALENILVKL